MLEFVAERELLFHVREGRKHDLAKIGEDAGFTKGDTVLGDGDKEFSEDMVDVGGGKEITVEGDGNFSTETLGFKELQFLPGMEGTEGRVVGAAQHAAAASVGKLKLATRSDTSTGILIRHGNIRHGNLLKVDLS
ncbi:MAG: hypothetical protein WA517_07290 [Candidatus Acidiferrum sp.]